MTAPLCCQNPEFLRQKKKASGVGNTPVSTGKTDTGECELPNTEFQTYPPVMEGRREAPRRLANKKRKRPGRLSL